MTGDLYDHIVASLGSDIEDVFDSKLPDDHSFGSNANFAKAVIVYYPIHDTPERAIDSTISGRAQRITLEVQAYDLTTARNVKELLINACNGFAGDTVTSCVLELAGPELYDYDLNPPRYCLPVDFTITT